MGKKKDKPSTPKAPNPAKPTSIETPFGSALYGGGKYTFSGGNLDNQNYNNLQSAQGGLESALNQVQNPQSAIQRQEDIYRQMMEPTFNQALAQQTGAAKAGLGKRYFGTFGQLSMNEMANQQARARATLEKDIYDSGQSAYNQLLSRAAQMMGLSSGIQSSYLQPYELMGNLLTQGGSNVTGYNNALSSIYSSQVAGSQPQQQSSGLGGALTQLAVASLPYVLA